MYTDWHDPRLPNFLASSFCSCENSLRNFGSSSGGVGAHRIQEALVELYLQNYPNSEVGTSGSAEAFVDSSSLSYDVYNVQNAGIEEGGTNNTYMHGIDNYAIQSNFPDANFVTRSHYEEATGIDAEAYMEHGTNANEFHEVIGTSISALYICRRFASGLLPFLLICIIFQLYCCC